MSNLSSKLMFFTTTSCVIGACAPPDMPADGVKGKTWGPSSGSNVSKSRPNIPTSCSSNEDSRWTNSAPSLDKTSATGIVPELDRLNCGLYYYQRPSDAGIPMATLYNNSYYFTNYDFPENSSPPGGRRLRMSVIEYLLYNMASMLASVAAGYDVRLSNLSAINPKLYPNNLDNEEKELKFWYSDSRVSRNSSSLYPHNTFHGLPVNNRVPLNSAVNFKSLRLTESTSHPSPSSPSVRRSSNASSSEDGKDVQYPPPPPVATGPGLDRPLFLSGQDYSSSDGHYTTTNNNNSYQSGGGYTMMRTQMFYQDQMDSIGSVGGCVHHDPYHVPPSRQYVETARRLDSLESVRSRQVSIEFPRSRGLDLIDHTVDQSSIRNRITEGYIDPNEPVDLRL